MSTNAIITIAIGILISVVLIGPISATINSQVREQVCSANPTTTRLGSGTAPTITAAGDPLRVPVRVGASDATATRYAAGTLCLYPTGVNAPTANTRLALTGNAAAANAAATAANLYPAPTPAGALAYDFGSSRSIIVLVPLGIVAGLVWWGYSAFTSGRRQGAM